MSGTEAASFELEGRIDPGALRLPLPPEVDADGAVVSVLLFRMAGLALNVMPWPRYRYGEALWRVGVRFGGEPAWLVAGCDLDQPVVRATTRWLVRYPVRAARFTFGPAGAAVRGSAGRFGVELAGQGEEVAAPAARAVLVWRSGRLYRVPWGESPPTRCTSQAAAIDDGLSEATFGAPAQWAARAVVLAGRGHRCGTAVLVEL